MWSLIGQFNLDWHPLVARVRLTGTGIGQLRTIETLDGREIVERLEAIDNAKRFYRYTLIAGIPASHYAGMLEVKPKGSGSVAEWRVQFLANNQPDIVVRTIGIDVAQDRSRQPEDSASERGGALHAAHSNDAIVELTDCPSATDGEIAAINLESARRRAWARFAQDPRRPGRCRGDCSIRSAWQRNFSAIWTHSTVWMRSPRNSQTWTTRLAQRWFRPRSLRQCIASTMHEATSRGPR